MLRMFQNVMPGDCVNDDHDTRPAFLPESSLQEEDLIICETHKENENVLVTHPMPSEEKGLYDYV